MVHVGFSTRKGFLSALVRLATKSDTSHAFMLIEIDGLPMVIEAEAAGFRMVTYERFTREGNQVVGLYALDVPNDSLRWFYEALGEKYDVSGLLGTVWVLVGRWFRLKWRNPFASSRGLFCSEAIALWLQAIGYENSDTLDPSATTPDDLMKFMGQ